jgi:hypothetical protein
MVDVIMYFDREHYNKYKDLRGKDPDKASAIMKKAQQVAYKELDKLKK